MENTFKWHALLTYKLYIILLLSLQLVWNNKEKSKWSYDIPDYIHQKCSIKCLELALSLQLWKERKKKKYIHDYIHIHIIMSPILQESDQSSKQILL